MDAGLTIRPIGAVDQTSYVRPDPVPVRQAVIRVANKKGILREPTLGLVADLKRHWTVAVSTEPLPRDAANESLSIVRHILSVTGQSHVWRSQSSLALE